MTTSSGRSAVTRESSCLSEPAQAFLGFANVSSPAASWRSLSAANPSRVMYASPRTSSSRGASLGRVFGIDFIVSAFAVMSSPMSPLPRVAALTRRPPE